MEQVPPNTVDALSAQGIYDPVVEGGVAPTSYERVIACGMGGSRLPAHLIRGLIPSLDIDIHASYGLPNITNATLARTHIVVCSFSGETAEAIDAFHTARKRGVMPSVVASGGKLLDLAKAEKAPYVQVPDIGISPREASILMTLGHLALFNMPDEVRKIQEGISLLSRSTIEAEAENTLKFISGKIPLLYGPLELEGVLRIFKVNFNETSRRPAFMGLLPEINHNEVEMFDGNEMTFPLTRGFVVLLFLAEGLDLRLSARIKLLADVLTARGVPVRTIHLEDWSWKSALGAIALSVRTSGLWAERSDLRGQPTALIQEFKEKMRPFDSAEQ